MRGGDNCDTRFSPQAEVVDKWKLLASSLITLLATLSPQGGKREEHVGRREI